MRDFSFLHMADLHLGSPFKGLSVDDPEVARSFAQAIRDTLSDLVGRAIEAKVDFVVIAGDVYDREWKDASVGLFFNREMARLDRAGIPVFLVKGNHDAASVVTRSVKLPDGVRTFGVSKASTIVLADLGVALHGQSYKDREAPDNLARDYPAAKANHFNIGVLHTSLSGYEGHDAYAPCSEADLVAKGYDYWALGHIHLPQVVRREPPIVYPGCIQGRSVRELGPHGAVLVRVRDGVPELETLEVDRVRWCVAEADLESIEDVADLHECVAVAIEAAVSDAGERLVALRVVLSGATALHGTLTARRDEVEADTRAAAAHLSSDIWVEKVKLATRPASTGPSLVPDLEESAELLSALDDAGADPRLLSSLESERTALLAKLPGEVEETFDTDAVLLEARALLSARFEGGGA